MVVDLKVANKPSYPHKILSQKIIRILLVVGDSVLLHLVSLHVDFLMHSTDVKNQVDLLLQVSKEIHEVDMLLVNLKILTEKVIITLVQVTVVSTVVKVAEVSLVHVPDHNTYLKMHTPAMHIFVIENADRVQGWFEVPIPIVNWVLVEKVKIDGIVISFVVLLPD